MDPWTQAMRETPPRPAAERPAAAPTLWLRLRWLALAAVPSSLMLGVTTYIVTDLASFPLILVIPLAVYLLTFVIVFSRIGQFLRIHKAMVMLQPLALALVLCSTASDEPILGLFGIHLVRHFEMILIHLVGFFVTAMVCHGELARTRPSPKFLTQFYLWMSLGGVVGGMFTAVAAPAVFNSAIEYPLMIGVACLLRPQIGISRWPVFSRWMDVLLPVAMFTLLFGLLVANHCDHDAHQKREVQATDDWHPDGNYYLPRGHWIRPTNQWLNEVVPLHPANEALVRWFAGPKPDLDPDNADLTADESQVILKVQMAWQKSAAKWHIFPEQWNLGAKATVLTLGVLMVFFFQFRPIRFGLGILVLWNPVQRALP